VSKLAVTVNVFEDGAEPPAIALNVIAVALNVKAEENEPIAFSVTGTVCVPVDAAIEIDPIHTVPAVIPDASAETVNVVAVGPAVKSPTGDKVNQLRLAQVCIDIWAVAGVNVADNTVNVTGAGCPPPANALNVMPCVLSVSTPGASELTFICTDTVCVNPPAVIEIVPLQVVPALMPD
jgi:hypothetical protein